MLDCVESFLEKTLKSSQERQIYPQQSHRTTWRWFSVTGDQKSTVRVDSKEKPGSWDRRQRATGRKQCLKWP